MLLVNHVLANDIRVLGSLNSKSFPVLIVDSSTRFTVLLSSLSWSIASTIPLPLPDASPDPKPSPDDPEESPEPDPEPDPRLAFKLLFKNVGVVTINDKSIRTFASANEDRFRMFHGPKR